MLVQKKKDFFLLNNDAKTDDFTKGNVQQFYVRLPENFNRTETFTGKKADNVLEHLHSASTKL